MTGRQPGCQPTLAEDHALHLRRSGDDDDDHIGRRAIGRTLGGFDAGIDKDGEGGVEVLRYNAKQ